MNDELRNSAFSVHNSSLLFGAAASIQTLGSLFLVRNHFMGKYWREWIQERFGDRSVLTRDEATRAFWVDLPREKLEEFFEFMEVEYSLDAGLLRPEDQLDRLTAPIKTKNPWRWFLVEPRIEDAASELNYEIWKRAQIAGLADHLPLFTIGEYVRVWCGLSP